MIASALRFTMLFLAATAACCGCLGAVHMEWTRQELPAVRAKGGDAAEMALPPECHEFILEGQLGFGGNHMGGGLDRQGWRVEMLDCDGHPLRRISATYGTAPLYDGFSDSRYLRVEIDSVSPDGSAVPLEKNELHDEKRLYGRTNTLTVDNSGGRLRVWLGKEGGIYVAGGDGIAGVSSLRFSGTRDVSVKNAMIKWRKDPAGHLRTAWNAADIQAAYAATQEGTPTGNWKFLDRDTDARWAVPGGKYLLAIVPHEGEKVPKPSVSDHDTEPAFDILYLDGAESNRPRWSAGMIKGHLYTTPFRDHYTLIWYDSFFEDMGDEATADIADGAILTLSFPLYKATLRFVKTN